MKILITGGAGFIGSNLCDYLITNRPFEFDELMVIDNLSLGKKEFIAEYIADKKLIFYNQDLLDFDNLLQVFEKHKFDLVWHLSANSDIGYGAKFTDWDLKQGTLVTYNVLECMKRTNVKKIIFSSTSAIYGEAQKMPTPEDYGPLFPISFYGASKLACEGLISSFCHNFDFQAWVFRFGNIVGHNGTHGALVDFINKLKNDNTKLDVLGDGTQAKPYLHVQDCVEGMIFGLQNSSEQFNFFNLACNGATTVAKIAELVLKNMNLPDAKINFTDSNRGWRGDVPQVRLSNEKMEKFGWQAKNDSDEAVDKAIKELLKQNI